MRPKLTVCAGIGLLMVLAFEARAADPPNPPKQREGRGFVVGMSLGPTRSRFSGAEDLALVFGDVVGTIPLCCVGGTTVDVRFGQLVPRSLLPANPEHVVPLPSSQDGATVSLQIGWSASRRLALLADFDLGGAWGDSFTHLNGAAVARYSPGSRLWLEAGPTSGDLSYGYKDSVIQNIAGTGKGLLLGAGFVLLTKPIWQLDLQVRWSTLWFDQFRTTHVSGQLGILRRRS